MIQTSLQRLINLTEIIPPILKEISETEFSLKPSPEKWSKKQILGHLVDSAANNHQRFVRVQFEELPLIVYDQNKWNTHSYYQSLSSRELIEFWTTYNKHLAALAKNIPEEKLTYQCRVGENETVTLEFIITDYVVHLEHHLRQIISYP